MLTDEPLLEQGPFPYDFKVALQHNDTSLVGSALAVRDQNWAYIYRLYEADELYSRHDDPNEMHNLAALPDYAWIRAQMRRQPNIALESPYQQFVDRGGQWS